MKSFIKIIRAHSGGSARNQTTRQISFGGRAIPAGGRKLIKGADFLFLPRGKFIQIGFLETGIGGPAISYNAYGPKLDPGGRRRLVPLGDLPGPKLDLGGR